MARFVTGVDVGHDIGERRRDKKRTRSSAGIAEEYRLKTMETTGPNPSPLYIKKPVISQVPYLRWIFPNPYLFIKPSTLMTQCDFFYLSLYG